ncbi:MAG: tetratricopeptide repeat protein [Thermoguttaceae bacterium]
MKRTAFAFSLLALAAVTLQGCSGSRPFWMAGKPKADGAQMASAGSSAAATAASPKKSKKFAAAERSVEGPLALARLAEQGGSAVEAERLYRSIAEKRPNEPQAFHRLAVMECQKGKFEEAEGHFQQALQLAPEDPVLLNDAGYHYYLQNRLDEAEPLFRKALEIRPDYESATNNLAMLVGERGDDQAAMNLFRQTGSEAEAYTNMGFVYSRRGDFARAKEAYNRALTLDRQMRAAAEALVQLSQAEKQARTMVAQQSGVEIRSGRAIPANGRQPSQIAVRPVPSPQPAAVPYSPLPPVATSPAPSAGQPASYWGGQEQAPAVSVQTAEFVARSQAVSTGEPVVLPDAVLVETSAAATAENEPATRRQEIDSLDARLKEVVAGFDQADEK